MPIRLLLAASLASYGAAWLLQLVAFRGGDAGHRLRSFYLAVPATLLHVLALLAFWATFGAPPLVGFGPVCATLALALVAGFLVASRTRERWSVGLLVLPLVMALLAASLVAGPLPADRAADLRGPWVTTHVLLVLGGSAGLLLSSVAAAMYLFQFRALKRKDFGNVFRFFPSLESLDGMNRIGLAAGLSALAVGLLTGWSLTLMLGRDLTLADPDVGFGLLTWGVYAIALGTRGVVSGLEPRSAAASVAAFFVSGLAFLAFRVLGPSTEFFL